MNQAEVEFECWAVAQGWHVTKRGWPDFICRRLPDEIMCVEVKYTDGLSVYQRETAVDLAVRGIPAYVWHLQDRVLTPVSEVTRLISDEQLTEREAIHHLGQKIALLEANSRTASAAWRDIQAKNQRLLAERAAEKAELARVMDDLGYLLRRAQDAAGILSGRPPTYTSRLKVLLRRYPELAYAELPGDG